MHTFRFEKLGIIKSGTKTHFQEIDLKGTFMFLETDRIFVHVFSLNFDKL